MESDLQKLRVELQRRLDELEILRKKLDSLEKLDRAGSARHEPVDEVPPSELGEPGELAEAEPVEPPAEPTGSGVR